MPKFFVIAQKAVELRGLVQARDEKGAKQNVRDFWYLCDTSKNTLTAGTGQLGGTDPVISETDQVIRIIHIEHDNYKIANLLKELEKMSATKR